jgi:hypothetical protein
LFEVDIDAAPIAANSLLLVPPIELEIRETIEQRGGFRRILRDDGQALKDSRASLVWVRGGWTAGSLEPPL